VCVCVCVCRAKDALGSSHRSSTGLTGGSRPEEGLGPDGGLDEDGNGSVEVGSGWDVRGFEVGGAPEGWVVQVIYFIVFVFVFVIVLVILFVIAVMVFIIIVMIVIVIIY
jgi:hypothetical protein